MNKPTLSKREANATPLEFSNMKEPQVGSMLNNAGETDIQAGYSIQQFIGFAQGHLCDKGSLYNDTQNKNRAALSDQHS